MSYCLKMIAVPVGMALAFVACADLSRSGFVGQSAPTPFVMSGQWQYRLGRHAPGLDPGPSDVADVADAARRDAAGAWRSTTLPATLSATLPELKTYRGWLTLRRALPDGFSARARRSPTLALYTGRWCDVSLFSIGGRSIAQIGAVEPYRSGCDNAALVELPHDLEPGDNDYIYVEVYSPGYFGFWAGGAMELGDAALLAERFYHRETGVSLLIGAYLLVGLYHLLLLAKRRKELQNLYFGLFCLATSAYWFLRSDSRQFALGDNAVLRMRLEYMALFAVLPPLLLFLSHFFHQRHSRIGLAAGAICGAFIGLAALLPVAHLSKSLLGWQFFALAAAPCAVFMIFRESWRGNRDARYLAVGCGLTIVAAVHDIFAALGFVNTPHLAAYAFTFFMLSIALVLANRFMRVHARMEELNGALEFEVRERTRELEHTLSAVQTLKVRQDADYFLTTLLLRPLNGVFEKSAAAEIATVLRPQKTFLHRGREHGIGGDFVFADRFELSGTDYAFVVNADAMGKSIQGAGGALVLGTVTRSIVTRTRAVSQARRTYPEQWLRNYVMELQSVFAAFEGAMTATIWAGLLDETCGVLYYVNAAHPRATLYRAGQARFLEAAVNSPAIGAEGMQHVFRVETTRLEAGDVVIAGSDGRDDLVLEGVQVGERRFNSDEDLFLRNIEASGAELGRLEAALQNAGELADDLSLVRLEFRRCVETATDAVAEPLASGASADCVALQRRIRLCMQGGDYVAAARLARDAARMRPEEPELIYLTACALKCAGDLAGAADFGERLRLRNPEHARNLLNLADAYRLQGFRERAAEALAGLSTDGRAHAAFARLQSILARPGPALAGARTTGHVSNIVNKSPNGESR